MITSLLTHAFMQTLLKTGTGMIVNWMIYVFVYPLTAELDEILIKTQDCSSCSIAQSFVKFLSELIADQVVTYTTDKKWIFPDFHKIH